MSDITLVKYNFEKEAYLHWCNGCQMEHPIVLQRYTDGPVWNFDCNLTSPTFYPHFDISMGRHPDGREFRCHYTISRGMIHYQWGTTHSLKNTTVPLPPFPKGYLNQEEISSAVSFYEQ